MAIEKDKQKYIEELAHLYVDGAFDRRELLRRVTRVLGSAAAASVALEALELPARGREHEHEHGFEFECECPADVRVPEDAKGLEVIHQVEFPGEARFWRIKRDLNTRARCPASSSFMRIAA